MKKPFADLLVTESEYQGKKVKLNDPIRTSENPNKKFKVYVKNEKGKVVVVRFGVTQTWASIVMTQRKENPFVQDTIVMTLALSGKRDIGHVINGEVLRK